MTIAALNPKLSRVAIVCGSPSSEHLAPFDDPAWDIWVLGNRLDRHKGRRVTRIFEIHDDLSEHPPVYPEWLAGHGIPLVVGEKFPGTGPNIQVFPFKQAAELFGSEYLTSSTAYMIALALLEGVTHIGLYGSDMSVDDNEYFWQRPCLEAWIGFAKGRGVDVFIPEVSPIGKAAHVEGRLSGGKPAFAKPPFTQDAFLAVAAMHDEKIAEIADQCRQLENKAQAHGGAKQAYERLAKVARAIEAGQDVKTLTDTVVIK